MTPLTFKPSAAAFAACLLAAALAPAAAQTPLPPRPAATPASAPRSGIDLAAIDRTVRPQDDLFHHTDGVWLKTTPIPADRSSVGAFADLRETTRDQLHALIQAAAKDPTTPQARQIADLDASFMNEALADALGVRPLAAELAAIDAIGSPRQLATLFARLEALGAGMPIDSDVRQDAKQATRYVPSFGQSGLGLPDRDYYLQLDDTRFTAVRVQYVAYLARLLTLGAGARSGGPEASGTDAGRADVNSAASASTDAAAQDSARAVLALETDLARVMTTRVQNRDPQATYNRTDVADLARLAPAFDWAAYLSARGFAGRTPDVIVRQPAYLRGLNPLLDSVPLATWKAYAKTHLLNAYAPYLSRAFVDARFAFVGRVLSGAETNQPRWKRGVQVVETFVGEALGQLYVAAHFPAQHKAQMEQLVGRLLDAYRQSIATLDWMSPATRQEAQAKLATFAPKIGYPKRWIDYRGLTIAPDDLVGNVMRGQAFKAARDLARLGKPVDRDEWLMTPQTVNAYYNAALNEIVFPAAVLQPPFFDAGADDAVNYGAIGAVIGHEISHGFDDRGSQSDGSGNLRDWWTAQDRARFKTKTAALVAQYAAFVPVPGYHLNGELTLGENIADNAGLAIAHKAWRLSLNGKPAPVIDGLTGEQRFFMAYAQVWRGKTRDAALLSQIKSDPHAPNEFRVTGAVRNLAPFHEAFGVKPGDAMYLAPQDRVSIW